MTHNKQHTLAGDIEFAGIGVHTGKEALLTIRPAPADSGLVFRRTDLPRKPEIPARLEYVTDTELGTRLGEDDVEILTVEHVLAALAVLEVDNAILDLDGPEIPILDGSFAPYFGAVQGVGRVVQAEEARIVQVSDPVTLSSGDTASYVALPDPDFRISATISFAHQAIGRQYGAFGVGKDRFRSELAGARTFGFKADAEMLRARGLAQGASLDNTVVLDDKGVMNGDLRHPDEFLRHKVGDIVGDLALLGGRFRGHVVAECPSHQGNVALARTIQKQHEAQARRRAIGVGEIMKQLPHRYPMLLVDRIVEFESGKRIVGLKNVTINEPFFSGHFPDHPVMPGVLIVEAMAQVGGVLLMETVEDRKDKVVYFMALDKVKWRKPVTPGDQVLFELAMITLRRNVCKMKGVGTVDGVVVAEAQMTASIVDR